MPYLDSALTKKLNAFVSLSDAEQHCLAELQCTSVKVKSGRDLFQEGLSGQKVFIIQSGWASSFKDLPDGGRQIISFPLPGDCVGLRSALLRKSDYSFSALTDGHVSSVEAARMTTVFDEYPRLRAAFMWSAARDEAMVVDHLVNIGRRSAIERTAHFFMELAERLVLVGLATETQFKCPLNQYVLADALGLSAIHVNRVLRLLRERDLMTVKAGSVIIHDLCGLQALAGYHSVSRQQN